MEKLSPFDFMTTILKDVVKIENLNTSSEANSHVDVTRLLQNPDLAIILTTSLIVFIGCVVVLFYRRSSDKKKLPLPTNVVVPKKVEERVDDGKFKVTVLFGTLTGTTKGFAKALVRRLNLGVIKLSLK